VTMMNCVYDMMFLVRMFDAMFDEPQRSDLRRLRGLIAANLPDPGEL
jgi:hypothetical protein